MSATWEIRQGDCIELMAAMPEASVDAIVTDPPYLIAFMARSWDQALSPAEAQARHEAWAREALRVLKPGGHLLAFGGTRTFHRLTCGLEDAGFEIRDCLSWMYGSGFPKSLDVSKAIDKAARRDYIEAAVRLGLDVPGNSLHDWTKAEHAPSDVWWEKFKAVLTPEQWGAIEREVVGHDDKGDAIFGNASGAFDLTRPATAGARRWEGWGTALKPAWEPIVLARKPLEGTVAGNVLAHGTGALNIDGCRIDGMKDVPSSPRRAAQGSAYGDLSNARGDEGGFDPAVGRWPANVALDETAAAMLDEQSGETASSVDRVLRRGVSTGGASRFFYCAKASKAERNIGLEGVGAERVRKSGHVDERVWDIPGSRSQPRANDHPTVKPVELMRWLCRLVTPPEGVILDPFAGSGTTGIAALREGFGFIGLEREEHYVDIARARIVGDAPLLNRALEAA